MEGTGEKNWVLANSQTGIDLCVSSVKEVEAPLGGTAVEYDVAVVSNLQLFQPSKNDDQIIHYSILKTYREFEDLVNKLRKKFPQCQFLILPKAQVSVEKNRSECDRVIQQIAASNDLVQSSVLLQFLGIDPKTKELSIDISVPKVQEEIQIDDKSPSGSDEKEDFDLFEELVKKERAKHKTPNKTEQKENVPTEIFVPQNEQSNPLVTPKNALEVKTTPTDRKSVNAGLFSEGRKPGDVSLFEDQDYGEALTKEDEQRFFLPETKTEIQNITSSTKSKEEHEDIFNVDDDLGELLKQNDRPSHESPVSDQELKPMMETKQTQPTSHTNQQSSLSETIMPSSPGIAKKLNKPPPPPKPKSLAKPIPPPKPKTSSSPAKKPDVVDSGELDIFKYIENEEKTSTQEVSLFD